MKRLALLLGLLALAAVVLVPGSAGRPLPGAARCPIFPRDNHWNLPVDRLPVHGNSDAIVRSIGAGDTMHADFGSGLWEGGPIGIPWMTVGRRQDRVPVSFEYASESDGRRYPIPPRVPIEGGRAADGDRHVILVDRARCKLYELFAAYPEAGGARWRAGSGAIWNLRSNRMRPSGWTSADAAGLPILPGLARYDEVKRGRIDHALRFTVSRSRRAFIYPARHFASDETDPDLPAMGQRLRLKARLRHLALPAPGAHRAPGAQALRHDRGRQRLVLVRERRAPPGLEQRPAPHAAPRARQRLRGGGHEPFAPPARGYSLSMWGATTVVSAFALAIVAMSFAFMGGAVIVAIPLAILGIGIAAMLDFTRRRKQATTIHDHRERAKSQKVEFTERDKQTLASK